MCAVNTALLALQVQHDCSPGKHSLFDWYFVHSCGNHGDFNVGFGNNGIGNHGNGNAGNFNDADANNGDFNTGRHTCEAGSSVAMPLQALRQAQLLICMLQLPQYAGSHGQLLRHSSAAGSRNLGDSNVGSDNAGSYNTGSRNAGDANAGSDNAGMPTWPVLCIKRMAGCQLFMMPYVSAKENMLCPLDHSFYMTVCLKQSCAVQVI